MLHDWPWRLTILALMLLMYLLRWRFRHQVGRAANRDAFRRDRADRIVFGICGRVMALGFFLYLLVPWLIAFAALPLGVWLRLAGLLPALGGLWLLAAADRALGANLSIAIQIKDDHRLVTSGPYAWLRHPIYAAGLLIFLGVGIISANWLVLACMLGAMTLLYAWRMPREDRLLAQAFGAEWEAWRRRTPALLPRPRPPRPDKEPEDG